MTILLSLPGWPHSGKIALNTAGAIQSHKRAEILLWSTLILGCVLGTFTYAKTASAAATPAVVGTGAGDFLVRVHVLGIFPEDTNSSTSIGGKVKLSDRVAPEIDFSYYFTDHLAAQLIATLTRPTITESGSTVVPGKQLIGATDVLPPTLTAQWHFAPHSAFNPYVGGGATFLITFASEAAHGNPAIANDGHKDLHTNTYIGPAVQVGADYNFYSRYFVNVEVDQVFVKTKATVDTILGPVNAKVNVNPFLVGVGVGYRF